jgi:hypothetical protein
MVLDNGTVYVNNYDLELVISIEVSQSALLAVGTTDAAISASWISRPAPAVPAQMYKRITLVLEPFS